jgi:hypothetical protein
MRMYFKSFETATFSTKEFPGLPTRKLKIQWITRGLVIVNEIYTRLPTPNIGLFGVICIHTMDMAYGHLITVNVITKMLSEMQKR